jgi:hypothetical protein
MPAVPDFGHALLKPLRAPKGRISTFAEVQLKDGNGKTHIPDGAIVVERGQTCWRCLVEVKTAGASLQSNQVNCYLDIARKHRLNAVLTISNDITASPAESPVEVDRRKLRSVSLVHLSWWRILTEAIVQQAPRRRRSRAGVGPRRADRLPGRRALRRRRLSGHGRELGQGPQRRRRRHAARRRRRRARRRLAL